MKVDMPWKKKQDKKENIASFDILIPNPTTFFTDISEPENLKDFFARFSFFLRLNLGCFLNNKYIVMT